MTTAAPARTASRATAWRDRLLDAAVIVAITLGVGLLSQRWTGLDTPDSSFYLSLGLHGDAITDRVAEPYYAWTRLGAILPMRALTELLGTFPGLEAYRLLLLLACVAGAFLTLRRLTDRSWAGLFTTMIMLSTVLLGYLGNPYLTRWVLAGTFLIIAIAASTFMANGRLRLPTRRASVTCGALAGIIVGWLVMTNPYGAILAGILWLVLVVAATLVQRTNPATTLLALLSAVITSLLTWGGILLAGRRAFPKLDWLQTYLDWNAKLTYSDFASPDPVWLGDISLLVPVLILITTIFVWLCNRRSLPAQLGLLLSAFTIAITFLLEPLMGGITLEAPMYQAMLWPSLLIAAACAAIAVIASPSWSWSLALTSLVALVAVVLTGRWSGALSFGTGVVLTAVLAITCCMLWFWASRPTHTSTTRTIAAVVGLAVLLAGAQLLQNSRRDLGLYYLSPYANAYLPNPIELKVRTAVNAQEFILQHTSTQDRIQLWVGGDWPGGDRELYVVAGMQLWGPNIATLEPILDEAKSAELRAAQPTVIEMVAPTMRQVLQLWSSLPADANPSPPDCYDFTWPSDRVQTGHACLTRLRWSESS